MNDRSEKHRSAFAANKETSASGVWHPGAGRYAAAKAIRRVSGMGAALRISAKNKRTSISTSKWVMGESLIRVAFSGKIKFPMAVGLIRPSASRLDQQCDRCRSAKHSNATLSCSATKGVKSPFSNPNVFYDMDSGRGVAPPLVIQLVNEHFTGRSSSGTGDIVLA